MAALEEEESEPVTPTGQYFNSSVLSLCILNVFESDVPIDDSQTTSLLTNVLLPISPRFSSIMVKDDHGVKQWRRVEVKLEDHVNVPVFPNGLSLESYDAYFHEYLTKIAMEKFPQSRPLWDIHIFKYPTSSAAGSFVIKMHHALGDGFSLMGALLSCFQRADNPSLPLTFPSSRTESRSDGKDWSIYKSLLGIFSYLFNTGRDFGWGVLKSSLVEDDRTPIRSGEVGVEFRPIDISTVAFSLEKIKQIKNKIGATVNDVLTGVIFYGTRLYMQRESPGASNAQSTALVLLSTRAIGSYNYKTVEEMTKPDSDTPWGNQFGFLHVSIPESVNAETANPLDFVFQAKQIIKRKRSSLAVFLTGRLLEMMRSLKGPEATAQYIHKTLSNTSMTLSSMMGPTERISLADHPARGFYFMVVGVPQSLTITVMSYMGTLRVAVATQKGFINHKKFSACLETAFERILKAAV